MFLILLFPLKNLRCSIFPVKKIIPFENIVLFQAKKIVFFFIFTPSKKIFVVQFFQTHNYCSSYSIFSSSDQRTRR